MDHVQLRTRDLEEAQRFYGAVLAVLGIEFVDDEHHYEADELWIDHGEPSSHVHLAFPPAVEFVRAMAGIPRGGQACRQRNGR